MTAARIHRLTLTNFRNYRTAQMDAGAGVIVLTGPNGAGKTNILESISLLTPGRGLRRATLDEIAFVEGQGDWAVSCEVEGDLGLAMLGTGIVAPSAETSTTSRLCRIDREPAPSATAFADHLRVLWLTPTMDGLFIGPASERRRFLDRLVLAVDAQHTGRVSALERSLRSRNRLLEDARADPHWLDAVEHETAELAVAVAALRTETVARLQHAIAAGTHAAASTAPFPVAAISLDGWMEQALAQRPAVEVEDEYRARLRTARPRDAKAGRTLEGPHRTDFCVRYAAKDVAAAQASTGEQKALLIGIILAHAGLIFDMTAHAPVLLLDEVVAHLDPDRRSTLYDTLEGIGAQVWITGADPAVFAVLGGRARLFNVTAGIISENR